MVGDERDRDWTSYLGHFDDATESRPLANDPNEAIVVAGLITNLPGMGMARLEHRLAALGVAELYRTDVLSRVCAGTLPVVRHSLISSALLPCGVFLICRVASQVTICTPNDAPKPS